MSSLRTFLRLWFSLTLPVTRRTYVRHGAGLVAFKYLVDTLAVGFVTGVRWSPLYYLKNPFYGFPGPWRLGAPDWFVLAMVLWTLPFIWIGVSMTMRRAVDAGLSPLLSLLFFLPAVNYALLLLLCLLPTVRRAVLLYEPELSAQRLRFKTVILAAGAGALAGVAAVVLLTLGLGSYGFALFLGTPVIVGAISGYLLNYGRQRRLVETYVVAMAAIVVLAAGLIAFALEGLACVVLALPIAGPLAAMGATLGMGAAATPGAGTRAAGAALLLPFFGAVESVQPPTPLHEVVSAIEIDAPPEVVWRHVVSFSELPEPSRWLFRTGIAYPQRARIDGTGVGAVRRCEFSTGAFVEPITRWDAPRRLSFDVVSQPPPLQEWSPFAGVHPPHLDGYFRAKRGEFRLTDLPGGRTRLEGSTWYELEMYPQIYWKPMADVVVGRIHRRVLEHVKRLSEFDDSRGRGE